MSTTIPSDTVHEAISGELAAAEERLSRLEQRQRETAAEIASLHAAVDAYRAVLKYRQGQRMPVSPGAARLIPTDSSPNAIIKTRTGGGRTPGNRSASMPPRNERFANVSIRQGFLALANEWGNDRPPDEFIRAVWVISTKEDRKRARRTAMSELASLAKHDRLVKTGRGKWVRYGLPKSTVAEATTQEAPMN